MPQLLVVTNAESAERAQFVANAIMQSQRMGFEVLLPDEDTKRIIAAGVEVPGGVGLFDGEAVSAALVMGGDGSILRAAELLRPNTAPLLSVNLGRVGFMAEAEEDEVSKAIAALAEGSYTVQQRMTLEVSVSLYGKEVYRDWALNEVTVEKAARERMLEVSVSVDEHALSSFGCDGVLVGTPTGSTAYAFSAGGPIVWPDVEALLMVPISAHALFARPMVLSPGSRVEVEVLQTSPGFGGLWCDGRRSFELAAGSKVSVRRGDIPVALAILDPKPFGDRLVRKFSLPVQGWRDSRGKR